MRSMIFTAADTHEPDGARRDLLLLLIVSAACILSLAMGFDDTAATGAAAARLHNAALAIVLAIAAAGGLALNARAHRQAERRVVEAAAEVAGLNRRLIAAEAVIKAEPQVLIFWEQGRGLKIIAHTLASVAGVPEDEAGLIKFGGWLEASAAADLKSALDHLFQAGRAFTLLLKTEAGGHLEADGRAVGGAAVLRLRDIAGHKLDLMRIIEQHRQLTTEIKAGRAALDALPVPVWIRSATGRLEWVNRAYVAAVDGSDRTEVITRGIELLAKREQAVIDSDIAAGRRSAARIQLIVGGERKPHDVTVEPVDGASIGIAIDMTAADAAKGQLDRELKSFDATLDKVSNAVAIFGPDQRLIYCNAAYTALWRVDRTWLGEGRHEGEILDRLREQSKLPAAVSYRDWKKKWLSIYNSGAAIEDWWHLSDDRIIHVLGEPRPDGGVVYVFEDATERLALESRYRTLIKVQRETLDGLKEAVAVFATDGRLKLFNAGFADIWGLSKAWLDEGPHIGAIIDRARQLFDDEQTWQRIASLVTSFAEQRDSLAGDMTRADGSIVDFAGVPLPDGGALISFIDVTTARNYERALVERNEALISADRLKTQFISHVSYELRTPLTNIIGFGDLLAAPRTGALNPRQRDYLADISVSSRTLLAIIDDILDLATIDAGALDLKLARADVRQILDEAILGVAERATRNQVGIEVDVATDATDLIADGARVRQVVYNLLSNAIGFSGPGQTVRVGCRREPGGIAGGKGDMLAFTVTDQGTGIPAEQQARIFERFVSFSQGARHRGAGLGLSIVKSLVELHGGDASIDSAPGRGTMITVRFPDAQVDDATPAQDDPPPATAPARHAAVADDTEPTAVAPPARRSRRKRSS